MRSEDEIIQKIKEIVNQKEQIRLTSLIKGLPENVTENLINTIPFLDKQIGLLNWVLNENKDENNKNRLLC